MRFLNFHWFLYQGLRLYWRLLKPTTLGSRILVTQGDDVLLVRLSYAKGWYLPGGGVDKGESFRAAAFRELKEECGLLAERADLFGLYTRNRKGHIDHVAVYVIQEFTMAENAQKDGEILESRFFPLRSLPETATPATKRRILEYLNGAPISDQW